MEPDYVAYNRKFNHSWPKRCFPNECSDFVRCSKSNRLPERIGILAGLQPARVNSPVYLGGAPSCLVTGLQPVISEK